MALSTSCRNLHGAGTRLAVAVLLTDAKSRSRASAPSACDPARVKTGLTRVPPSSKGGRRRKRERKKEQNRRSDQIGEKERNGRPKPCAAVATGEAHSAARSVTNAGGAHCQGSQHVVTQYAHGLHAKGQPGESAMTSRHLYPSGEFFHRRRGIRFFVTRLSGQIIVNVGVRCF